MKHSKNVEENGVGKLESPRKEIVEFLRERGFRVLVAGRSWVEGEQDKGRLGRFVYNFEFTGEKLSRR